MPVEVDIFGRSDGLGAASARGFGMGSEDVSGDHSSSDAGMGNEIPAMKASYRYGSGSGFGYGSGSGSDFGSGSGVGIGYGGSGGGSGGSGYPPGWWPGLVPVGGGVQGQGPPVPGTGVRSGLGGENGGEYGSGSGVSEGGGHVPGGYGQVPIYGAAGGMGSANGGGDGHGWGGGYGSGYGSGSGSSGGVHHGFPLGMPPLPVMGGPLPPFWGFTSHQNAEAHHPIGATEGSEGDAAMEGTLASVGHYERETDGSSGLFHSAGGPVAAQGVEIDDEDLRDQMELIRTINE